MSIPYSITPTTLNIVLYGQMRSVTRDHPHFGKIRDLLKNGVFGEAQLTRLRDLLDIKKAVTLFTDGVISVDDAGSVRYQSTPVHNYAAERLFQLLKDGFDPRPLARFIVRLYKNPNTDLHADLFKWLEHGNMPLTADGCFIAFKKVAPDYSSYADSGVMNRVGDRPSMPMELVDKDRNITCSTGLHFCSYEYLPGYHGDKGHVMLVKVAPEDVGAIPTDYNLSKGRACAYDIIGEVPEADAATIFAKSRGDTYGGSAFAADDDVDLEDDPYEDTEEEYTDDEAYDEDLGDIGDDEPMTAETLALNDTVFEHNGRTFSASFVKSELEGISQREFCRRYDVPRATLYGWRKRIL